MATSGVCFFCRITTCQPLPRCNCGSDFVPLFLTYLDTIKMDKNYTDNFHREDFHSCEKCATLLQTISGHLQKLEQDLFKMYTTTLENLDRDELIEGDDVLEKMRRKSVSQFNPSVPVTRVQIDLESRRPPESDSSNSCPSSPICNNDDPQSDLDVDAGPFKIELDDGSESDPEFEVVEQISDPEWEDLAISLSQGEETETDNNDDEDDDRGADISEDLGESSSDDSSDITPPRKRRRLRKSDPLRVKKSSQEIRKSPRIKKVTSTPLETEESTDNEPEREMVPMLHRGMEITSDGSIFKCGTCNFIAISWAGITNHLGRMHEAKDRLPFGCSSCGSLFSSQDLLTSHVNKCHPEIRQQQQNVAVATPDPTMTHDKKCDECDLSFKTDASLANHKVEVHLKGARYYCEKCGVRFLGVSNYEYHTKKCEASSQKEGPEVVIGDAGLPRSSYLGIEMKKVFMDEDAMKGLGMRKRHSVLFECGSCKYQCANKGNMREHIRVNHTDNVPLKCLKCGFVFASQSALDQHLIEHPLHHRVACKICQAVFTTQRILNNHVLKVHEKVDRLSCSRCGREFKKFWSFEKHKHTCGGELVVPQKFDQAAQKAKLDAELETIRGHPIISNYCKFCRKMVFGSAATFSLHEKICRNSATDLKWGESLVPVQPTGLWLLANVEISMIQILENPVVTLYKCGACNETFFARDVAKEHAREANHGKVGEEG